MKSRLTFLFVVCTGLTLPQIVSAQHYRCEQGPVIKLCPPTYSQPHYGYSEHHQQCEPARVEYREFEPVREVCEVSNCISLNVPKVICVQRELTRCGYFLRGPHPANGVCDDQTVEAVRSYQRAKGLPVTGKVDASLLSAMEIQASANDNPASGKSPAPTGAPNPAANRAPVTEADANATADPNAVQEPNAVEPPRTNQEPAPGPTVNDPKSDTVPAKVSPEDSKQAPEEILIAEEVAKLLRVQEKDVVDLFEKGDLPGKKFGDSWRTTRTSVINYLNAGK